MRKKSQSFTQKGGNKIENDKRFNFIFKKKGGGFKIKLPVFCFQFSVKI